MRSDSGAARSRRLACDLHTDFVEANLGCKRRLASGLDWVFSQADEAILIEDDCLPAPEFFRFSEEMLTRYRDDDRIHMVRGTNLLFGERFSEHSYYFSRFYNVWGWATWARAWAHYDVEMRQWPALRDSGWLEELLEAPQLVELVRHFFDGSHSGRLDQWDFQWAFAGWQRDALAVVPASNLVTNIGHGPQATHTHAPDDHRAGLRTAPLTFPLRHPPDVTRLAAADEHEWRAVYPFDRERRRRRWPRLRRAS